MPNVLLAKTSPPLPEQQAALQPIAAEVAQGQHRGKTITLKLRYSDFSTHTRSQTIDRFTDSETEIYAVASRLLEEHPRAQPFRLLGISVSNLDTVRVGDGGQLTL